MNFYFFECINQFAKRWLILDKIGIFFAAYLGYILILVILLFLFINFGKYWKMILGAFAAGVIARFLIVSLIRKIYPLARPFVLGEVNLLIYRSPSNSFPSGHASFFFALSFFLFFWFKNLKRPPKHGKLVLAFFFASSFLIGAARIFCGIHWPIDILGAIIVGLFTGWITEKATSILLRKL